MELAESGGERGEGAKVIDFPSARHPPAPAPSSAAAHGIVAFDRRELNEILNIYGRMVAAGEWRDYAIDMLKDRAVFSIFRRTSEMPLFRVEKTPRLARRQGAFSVTAAGGLVMKRGHELGQVLKVFDKALRSVEER
ncbi:MULTISPECIES: DUF2794 domain-containing protein [unclassified Aureimonas]|uniref:DUF2794 domain-containing protein n=1 Tax=unclassified Aureimonas TaxID=2615206 RepID=UPI000701616E|nr:DUF2794 domain-containing protein [Aureimonas sp. Leaf427]KQT65909.1 hypothetical protein ASG62_20485 [Aureimonas sp. Leaf427]KQT73268.1 hypothetical protein ASG54_16965 [Aureimonas sp. Leaf460]